MPAKAPAIPAQGPRDSLQEIDGVQDVATRAREHTVSGADAAPPPKNGINKMLIYNIRSTHAL